ncbi:MAG TPA: hypothetical protein VGQ83_02730 [Polyangia bacterium]
MDERLKRLIELKHRVEEYFDVTGVGVSGWEAGFEAVRHNDALAESFVGDLRRLITFIEREMEQTARAAIIAAAEAPAGGALSAGAAASRTPAPPARPAAPPTRPSAAPVRTAVEATPARPTPAAPSRPTAAAPSRPTRPEPTRPAGGSASRLGPPMQRPAARPAEPPRAAGAAPKPAERGHSRKTTLPERSLKTPHLKSFSDGPEDPTDKVDLLPPPPSGPRHR